MPVYKARDMQATPDVKNPNMKMVQFGGELIKVGIVTYQEGEGPPPHYHPNDEQYVYVLEGRAASRGTPYMACGSSKVPTVSSAARVQPVRES